MQSSAQYAPGLPQCHKLLKRVTQRALSKTPVRPTLGCPCTWEMWNSDLGLRTAPNFSNCLSNVYVWSPVRTCKDSFTYWKPAIWLWQSEIGTQGNKCSIVRFIIKLSASSMRGSPARSWHKHLPHAGSSPTVGWLRACSLCSADRATGNVHAPQHPALHLYIQCGCGAPQQSASYVQCHSRKIYRIGPHIFAQKSGEWPITLISKGGMGVLLHSKLYLALLFLISLCSTPFPYLTGTIYSKTGEKIKPCFLLFRNWVRLGIVFLAQWFFLMMNGDRFIKASPFNLYKEVISHIRSSPWEI